MKRYLSVFGLAARSSFWQGLALMIVSVALAGALLYLTSGSVSVHYVDEYGADQTYEDDLALSELPKASKMAAPLAGGLGGLCSVLAKSGGGKGAKTGYTMRRLQVREGTACLLWVVYDFMMLLLFWALAALVIFGVMTLRMKNMPEPNGIGPQSLILAYYGSALFAQSPAGGRCSGLGQPRRGDGGLRRGLRGRGGEGLAGEARRYRHGHRRDTDRSRLLRGSSTLIILYPAHSGPGYCDRAYHLQLEGRRRG